METSMKNGMALLIASLSLTLSAGCDDKTAGEKPPAADNTKVNERDRGGNAVTPMDQSNAPADLETTRRIRQALVADDTMSSEARNIKIITGGGAVVIRGPVRSQAERAAVESIARRMAGANRVELQIEVAPEH